MSNFHRGSYPKDAHQQLGKQDQEFRERHSFQVHSSSNNNQDEDFREEHSPLMHMSSENKIQQQQEPQLINGTPFQQGYPLKDKSSQISSHSQQTLVTTPQVYPPKDGSPLNHQSSNPDLQQEQSSTKISTPQEHSSKGDHLTNPQNSNYLTQQKLLAGATSGPLPQQQPSPILAPPPKNSHLRESNQSSHQSHKQSSPVTALSERHLSKDDYTAGSQNSKNLQQQQPSYCLQGEPAKQVHQPKHTIPMEELNTSCAQEDSIIVYDPHKAESSSIKFSTQGHATPLKSEEHDSDYQKTVTEQKDEALTKKVTTNTVESTDKNIAVPRTPSKSSSCCPCSIL